MKKEKSGLRKVAVDSLIILGLTVAILLVLEGFLRLFLPQNLIGVAIKGKTLSYLDESLGMQYVPGAIWRLSHPEYKVQYTINERGFRDAKDHLNSKPDHKIRILLLGDSFTFGQGVNYDYIWPVLVEKRLDKAGKTQFELVKAGVQGMDTRSEFLLMQRLLDECQCDVIVVGFLINDLYTNTLHGIENSHIIPPTDEIKGNLTINKDMPSDKEWYNSLKQIFINRDTGSEFHLLTLAKRLAISFDEIYCRSYLAAPDRGEWLTMPISEKVKKQLHITEMIFKEMARYSRSQGKRLIVLSIPQQFQVLCYERYKSATEIDIAFYDRYFSVFAKENDFDWVWTLDDFVKAKLDGAKLFFRLDGHLTPKGNEVVSQVFVNKIVPMIE